MRTRRWTNPSHPQTLYIAVILLYVNAGFGLLLRQTYPFSLLEIWLPSTLVSILLPLILVGMAASAFFLANDRRLGYQVAVGLTCLEVALLIYNFTGGSGRLDVIGLLFTGARAALLLHPMSRTYQRVYFT